MSARKYTTQLLEMIDSGLVSNETIVNACLSYMSEAEVEDMMRCNELLEDEQEEE